MNDSESGYYRRFLKEKEEILRHKWYESEKAGLDIGFEKALLDWVAKYRKKWLMNQEEKSKENDSQKCSHQDW